MKLIPLDAVIAEIMRRINCYKVEKSDENIGHRDKLLLCARIAQCEELASFLNSLKVKEVDLETEIERVRKHHYVNDDFDKVEIYGYTITNIAKHFFELGLKASNPLTWEDIETIGKLQLEIALEFRRKELESPINNPFKYTKKEFCKEVLKRFKEKKEEKA